MTARSLTYLNLTPPTTAYRYGLPVQTSQSRMIVMEHELAGLLFFFGIFLSKLMHTTISSLVLTKIFGTRFTQLCKANQQHACYEITKLFFCLSIFIICCPITNDVFRTWGEIPTWSFNPELKDYYLLFTALFMAFYQYDLMGGQRNPSLNLYLHHLFALGMFCAPLSTFYSPLDTAFSCSITIISVQCLFIGEIQLWLCFFIFRMCGDNYSARAFVAKGFNASFLLGQICCLATSASFIYASGSHIPFISKITALVCVLGAAPQHIFLHKLFYDLVRVNTELDFTNFPAKF